MYGGFGSWLFTGVAGLARAPGSRGWQALLFRPAAFVHAAVTSASASVATPIGLAAISWLQAPPTPTACALGVQGGPNLQLQCVSKSVASPTFSGIKFASYGLPSGSCAAGFARNASCDNSNTTAHVSKACVGKGACEVDAGGFGDPDPCPVRLASAKRGALNNFPDRAENGRLVQACLPALTRPRSHAPPPPYLFALLQGFLKEIAVLLDGPCDATILLRVSISVPVGASATAILPLGAGRAASSVSISEAASGAFVWAVGAFVPGTLGVMGAAVGPPGSAPVGQASVVLSLLSGSYSFDVLA
jgi:hypothetical protein